MKKTVIQNIVCVMLLVFIVSIVGALYNDNETRINNNSLLSQLQVEFYNSEDFEPKSFIEECKTLLEKLDEGDTLSAEEYLYVGYQYTLYGDYENAVKYSRLAAENMDSTTNTFIKFYIGFTMNFLLDSLEDSEELMDLGYKIFNLTSINELNTYTSIVIKYIDDCFTIGGSYEYYASLNELLDKNDSELNTDLNISIKTCLSICYSARGKFAKSIEKSLEVLSYFDNENISNNRYKIKAYRSLGSVYEMLGDLDYAKNYYMLGLNIQDSDDIVENLYKLELLSALISVDTVKEDYDSVERYLIDYKYLTEIEDIRGYTIPYHLYLANYYIKIKDYDLGVKHLEETKILNDMYGEALGISVGDSYKLAKANLASSQGNKEEALRLNHEVLDASEFNTTTKKIALQKLTELYAEKNDLEKALEYSMQLEEVYKEESKHINDDYIDYSSEKYNYEVELKKLNSRKIKQYLYIFITILISSCLIIIVIMKNRKLTALNSIDGLTNVLNRNEFNKRYKALIEKKREFYILIFDIDNFKKINDTYGHIIGDEVLKNISKVTKEIIKENGNLFRYGGEEFIVIFDDAGDEVIVNLAEKIRKEIEAIKYEVEDIITTISIGISSTKEISDDYLSLADERLYISKTSGKNKFTYK